MEKSEECEEGMSNEKTKTKKKISLSFSPCGLKKKRKRKSDLSKTLLSPCARSLSILSATASAAALDPSLIDLCFAYLEKEAESIERERGAEREREKQEEKKKKEIVFRCPGQTRAAALRAAPPGAAATACAPPCWSASSASEPKTCPPSTARRASRLTGCSTGTGKVEGDDVFLLHFFFFRR